MNAERYNVDHSFVDLEAGERLQNAAVNPSKATPSAGITICTGMIKTGLRSVEPSVKQPGLALINLYATLGKSLHISGVQSALRPHPKHFDLVLPTGGAREKFNLNGTAHP